MLGDLICCLAGLDTALSSPSSRLLASMTLAQRSYLTPLLTLASHCRRLRAIVDAAPMAVHGIYGRCLRRALQLEVLLPYETLLQASYKQMDGRKDVLVPLTQLRVLLGEQELILPAVVAFFDQIEVERIRGVAILDCLYNHSQSGIPAVQRVLSSVLHGHMDKVIMHQIVAWIEYGLLADPFSEFWVQHNVAAQQTWNSAYSIRPAMLSCDYLSVEICASILFVGKATAIQRASASMNLTTHQYGELLKGVVSSGVGLNGNSFHILIESMRREAAQDLWEYIVEGEHLLNHLSDLKNYFFLANGAFYEEFITESAAIMTAAPIISVKRAELEINQSAFQVAASKFGLDDQDSFQRFHLIIAPTGFDENLKTSDNIVCSGSARRSESDRAGIVLAVWSPSLEGSAEPEVSLPAAMWHRARWTIDDGFRAAFTFTMTGIARIAFVLQNDHLEAVGEGIAPSFNVMFASVATDDDTHSGTRVTLSSTASSSTPSVHFATILTDIDLADGHERCVTIAWSPFVKPRPFFRVDIDGRAAVDLDADTVHRGIRIIGRRAFVGLTSWLPQGPRPATVTARSLSLNESVAGSSNAINWSRLSLHYKVPTGLELIFREQEIDRYSEIFTFLLRVKRIHWRLRRAWSTTTHATSTLHATALLRSRMQFLLDNLQIYLQVDVIEAQYVRLRESIQASKDFEAVRLAHDRFLAVLAQQCFLQARVIMRALEHVFEVCGRFCDLIEGDRFSVEQCDTLREEFHREACFLVTVLSSKTGNTSAPHLNQLVLRINYNEFFATLATQVGMS